QQLPDADEAVEMRLLNGDTSGSYTAIVRSEAGGSIGPAAHGAWEEIYFAEGAATLDGVVYEAGSYLCLPPGARTEPLSVGPGAPFKAYVVRDIFEGQMDKPEVRLTAAEVQAIEPEKAQAGNDGEQQTLARGKSGS